MVTSVRLLVDLLGDHEGAEIYIPSGTVGEAWGASEDGLFVEFALPSADVTLLVAYRDCEEI